MRSEWWNEVRMTCFQIQIKILRAKIEASYWSRAQNRGLSLVERTPGKKSKALTLIWKFHSFQCHSTHSDVFPFILTSFHYSDVIPFILTSFHHSDVIPFISMSLQSFYIGMIERGENERDFRIKVRALDFFPGVLSTNERPLFWALDQ